MADTTAEYLTPRQLAKRYGVTLRTIYSWNVKGSGPRYLRVGRQQIRYRVEDVDAWEAARSGGGEAATA